MRFRPLLAALATSVVALTGCSVPSIAIGDGDDIPREVVDRLMSAEGVPAGVADPDGASAVWISNESFAFLGGGSSDCHTYPRSVTAINESLIEVELGYTGDGRESCFMNLVLMPYEIATPAGIDTDSDVVLRTVDDSTLPQYRVRVQVIADR